MSGKTGRGRERVKRWAPVLLVLERTVDMLPRKISAYVFRRLRSDAGLFARALRFALLRKLAASCGEIVDVREDVFMAGLESLRLGDRVSVHPFTYIDATGGVEIGSDVSIAHA